jgi:hypothetical protein
MVLTMACPNFKKGMKMAFGPLGVNFITKQVKQLQNRWKIFFLILRKGRVLTPNITM